MIKIYDSFSANTYNEFVNAMARLLAAGCKSFILDLRGNGGGVMDAAVNICNEFLPAESPIVLAQGKSFPLESVVANGLGTLISQPLVVLVDQLSASASEIIAGAIQDNDRGVIVGRRTFGKGLIQNQIELSDGSAIRLTVARYYTPSGRSIQRKYELGHSDDYALDWLDRFDNGEEFSADSIRQDTSVVYTTAHGRKVFGGGGIAPDVFVPLDTAEMTTYFMHLQNNDIFRIFGGYYSDRNRARLAEFKDWRQMLEYLKTQPLLYEITHFAEQYGIRRRSALISTSSRSIVRYACANILLNFFGEETFFIVAMNDDPVVQKAIEILQLDENIY
jgi:carboxyl-terminal processing protease